MAGSGTGEPLPVFDLSEEFLARTGRTDEGADAETGGGEEDSLQGGSEPSVPEEPDLELDLTLAEAESEAADRPADVRPQPRPSESPLERSEAPPEASEMPHGGSHVPGGGSDTVQGASAGPAESPEAPSAAPASPSPDPSPVGSPERPETTHPSREVSEPRAGDPFEGGGPGERDVEPSAPGETAMSPEPQGSALEGALEGSDDVMDFSVPSRVDDLDLEPPLSEFTLDPAIDTSEPRTPWNREAGGSGGSGGPGGEEAGVDDDVMQFGSGQAEPPEEAERKMRRAAPLSPPERRPRPQRTPRNRPSPPRRVRRHSPLGVIAAVLVVVALAAGGWYGWTWHQARAAAELAALADSAHPEVTIPEIPAALLPRMRTLGNAALSATIARLGVMERGFGIDAEPDTEWLAGIYMANASRYGGVREYWQRVRDFVDSVRAVDGQVFHEEYARELRRSRITGDTARMLLDRADSGFAATRRDRGAAYTLMDDLVSASLDLHQFLLDNESQIDYEPAAGGVSRDPVLEAVPQTKELGKEMWSRVDRITAALDSLGTLDKVTTKQLMTALFDRLRKAGFQ